MTIVKTYERLNTVVSVLLDKNDVVAVSTTKCKDLGQALELMDKLINSIEKEGERS